MNKQTVGTCGNCGGCVAVDTVYLSVIPPKPQCQSCGAYVKENFGPVLPMEPSPHRGASNRWYDIVTGTNTNRIKLETDSSIPVNQFRIYQTK